jgi:transcriptional regulator of NAD metabolism
MIERKNAMNAEARRRNLLTILSSADAPVNATTLANKLDVSRQVIVNDIAFLRASGSALISTPRGYLLQKPDGSSKGIIHQIACLHDSEGMRAELYAIVDAGCKVIDVVVEHPVYGQLVGMLQLSSRSEIEEFISRCSEAKPLSSLTGGVHLHTILCPSDDAFVRVKEELKKQKVLIT